MNDSGENTDPVELSPTRAELIARVRSRGRQIRARRRLGIVSIAAIVVVAIAAPAIAIGTRSSSTRLTPAVTTAATKASFRVRVVTRVQTGVRDPGDACVPSVFIETCYVLGRTLVTEHDVRGAAVETGGSGWAVIVSATPDAIRRLQTAVGHAAAIVVDGVVQSAPEIDGGITGHDIEVTHDGMTRDEAIRLATRITGKPPTHVDPSPSLSARIELPGTEFVAGTDVHGTLVVDNTTGRAVTLPRAKNGCWIPWGVDITNDQVPVDLAFDQPCLSRDTVLEPGTNPLPFTLSTNNPVGTYDVVLVPTTGLFPTPPLLTITLITRPINPLSLGTLSLRSGARSTKLLVPKSWKLAIIDAGGSGSSSTWTNPADPNEKIAGSTGGEIGSWWQYDGVKGSITPELPPGAQIQRVNYTTFLYHYVAKSGGYPIDGVWIGEVAADGPYGYVTAQVELPNAFHSNATTILNRFISDTKRMFPLASGPPKP